MSPGCVLSWQGGGTTLAGDVKGIVKRLGASGFVIGGVAVCAVVAGFALVVAQRGKGIAAAPTTLRPVLPQVARYVERHWRGTSGRMFCGVRYLGNAPTRTGLSLYVWEVCEQYRTADGRLVLGTAWSAPAVVTLAAAPSGYRILDEQQPVDYTEPRFSQMFPNSRVRSAIRSLDGSASTAPGMPAAMLVADARRARHDLLHR
jgi:hypothetical protein